MVTFSKPTPVTSHLQRRRTTAATPRRPPSTPLRCSSSSSEIDDATTSTTVKVKVKTTNNKPRAGDQSPTTKKSIIPSAKDIYSKQLALKDTFPNDATRRKFSKASWGYACKKLGKAGDKYREGDQSVMFTIIEQESSIFRGKFRNAAIGKVEQAYKLNSSTMMEKTIAERVAKLLNKGLFVFRDPDAAAGSPQHRRGVYRNSVLPMVGAELFKLPNSIGTLFKNEFNPMNRYTVALIATSVASMTSQLDTS